MISNNTIKDKKVGIRKDIYIQIGFIHKSNLNIRLKLCVC